MAESGSALQLGLISYLYLAENYCDIVLPPTGQSRFDQALGLLIKRFWRNEYVTYSVILHHVRQPIGAEKKDIVIDCFALQYIRNY